MKKIVVITVLAGALGWVARADETTADTTATNAAPGASPALAWNPAPASVDYVGRLGVGLIVGEPTGASVKYWFNDKMAVDGAAGWSFHDHSDFYVHGDVLWHDFDLLPVSHGLLPVYFGVGAMGRIRNDNRDNEVGIRVPVGVSYMFDRAPVDVFVEVAPGVDVAPTVRADITGGVGIRYWF